MNAKNDRVRLLLVGAGHASIALLKAAGRWTRAGVEVTLVNDARHLYYSGMTPEFLGGTYRAQDVRIDLLRWCLTNRVRLVQSRAVGIDTARRTVRTVDGDELACDLAVLDVGAVNPLADRAGAAVRTRPLHDLVRLAAWLEDALREDVPPRSLVVVGGGAAGVELALNVAARARSAGGQRVRVTLVHPGGRLMEQFAAGLGRHAGKLLREGGVSVREGRVVGVEPAAVLLEGGERLPQDVVVWATGTAGQAMLGASGLPVDERGFVRVDRALRVHGQPWLFAAGDCATVEGLQLDRSGVNAVKQGLTLRGNLGQLLPRLQRGEDLERLPLASFRPYPVAPYLVSTGTPEALLALGPHLWLRGRPLLWLKHTVDRLWVSRYQQG